MPVIKHLDNKSVNQTVARFNGVAQQTVEEAKKEYGSSLYAGTPKFDKHAQDYGRPLVGTKSQARGVRGGEHVMREVIFLCEMIEKNGIGTPPDCYIKFGPLFYMYSRISETLVGMLIRARKYGLLDFEGEMLYQRQDDHKHIRLMMTADEIRQRVEYSGDPVNVIKLNRGIEAGSESGKPEKMVPGAGKEVKPERVVGLGAGKEKTEPGKEAKLERAGPGIGKEERPKNAEAEPRKEEKLKRVELEPGAGNGERPERPEPGLESGKKAIPKKAVSGTRKKELPERMGPGVGSVKEQRPERAESETGKEEKPKTGPAGAGPRKEERPKKGAIKIPTFTTNK